jgi:nucleotide-binding universal stress UspA family protein
MTPHPADPLHAPGPTLRPAGPVVLGTEFGAVSAAAEHVAIALAKDAGVPLLIVHGIDPGRLRLPGGRFHQRVDQARAARQSDALAMMDRVRKAGVEPQLLIWDGDPATCIVDAARADCPVDIVRGGLAAPEVVSVIPSVARS